MPDPPLHILDSWSISVTMAVNNGEPIVWLDWRFKMMITMVAWRCIEGWRRRTLDRMQRDQLWISVSIESLDGRDLGIDLMVGI